MSFKTSPQHATALHLDPRRFRAILQLQIRNLKQLAMNTLNPSKLSGVPFLN